MPRSADDLIAFLGDAPLVAHNAASISAFSMPSSSASARPLIARERLVDTLLLARRKHPGGSNRLDDLCARYGIDNSRRTKHGALLDAELLAEVYVELIGARQAQLVLSQASGAQRNDIGASALSLRARPVPLPPRLTDAELAAHARSSPRSAKRRSGGLSSALEVAGGRSAPRCGGSAGQALVVERDEIDRIEQQRREAAVAHGGGDDLARERKQEPRALDHDDRLQLSGGMFWMRKTPAKASRS